MEQRSEVTPLDARLRGREHADRNGDRGVVAERPWRLGPYPYQAGFDDGRHREYGGGRRGCRRATTMMQESSFSGCRLG
jgi:hypothetical protein